MSKLPEDETAYTSYLNSACRMLKCYPWLWMGLDYLTLWYPHTRIV